MVKKSINALDFIELKDFLDLKVTEFNTSNFIADDPISIVHQFNKKEDIEIIGFLVATIAWGNRRSIITSAKKIVSIMGNDPYEYILNYRSEKLKGITFVHRTFNTIDLDFFFRALQNIYDNEGMEQAFTPHPTVFGTAGRIIQFRKRFLETPHETRSEKHLSNPEKGSAAKRIQMFTRVIREVN